MTKYDTLNYNYAYLHGANHFIYHNHFISNKEIPSLFEKYPICLQYYNKSVSNSVATQAFGSLFIISSIGCLITSIADKKDASNYLLGGMGLSLVFGFHFSNRENVNLVKAFNYFNQNK